jgi:hypothetical protein
MKKKIEMTVAAEAAVAEHYGLLLGRSQRGQALGFGVDGGR